MTSPIILLVDDEPAVLRALVRTLRALPYQVMTAPSGAEALAVLARNDIALVISDIDMPGISGLDLMRRVREEFPSVARVVLTGQRDFSAAVRAINEGEVSKFLLKPWDNRELRGVVVEAVGRHAEPGAASAEEATRRQAIAEIKRLHANLDSFPDGRDPYPMDEARMEALAKTLDDPTLVGLMTGSAG